jgi:D-aminoacyl-tRNA deacylase
MIALIQRVRSAAVYVREAEREIEVGRIGAGLLALIAVEKGDSAEVVPKLLHKLLHYRVFSDANGKMNLSLKDTQGGLLLVSQFTLAADTQSGLRPSFSPAASPEQGQLLFNALLDAAKSLHAPTASGRFGADMQVHLINDGPVTFSLRVPA